MKSIQSIIKSRYGDIFEGYYIYRMSPDSGYNILDSSFRMIYQGKFKTWAHGKYFVERNIKFLEKISQLKFSMYDIFNSDYFNGGYNYYGELIDKSGS